MQKRFITDLDQCKKLWNAFSSPKNIFDLWEFRLCFHRQFKHRPCFLLLEDRNGIAGMLPLSYVRDVDMFVFFPGEIWKEKTWIERTPVYVREPYLLSDLILACPERTYLRYMDIPPEVSPSPDICIDEIGYVLYPPSLGFDVSRFHGRFSPKRLKEIKKVVRAFTGIDCHFHVNRVDDFDRLAAMSIDSFESNSYLYDIRFREGFREIMDLLHENGMLRMLSLEIGGQTAAVDIGALFEGVYTVLLGGTHGDFLGIAKAMNMHHITSAFDEGLSKVDFLCGDFHWKKLWHLDPEPLYKFVAPSLYSELDKEQPPFMEDEMGVGNIQGHAFSS